MTTSESTTDEPMITDEQSRPRRAARATRRPQQAAETPTPALDVHTPHGRRPSALADPPITLAPHPENAIVITDPASSRRRPSMHMSS